MSKETDNLIRDVSKFIKKVENSAQKNQLTCGNCFQNLDDYKEEKILFDRIKIGNFSNTKEQGDALEELVKLMFSRIDLVESVTITTKETAIGQIDIILIPLRDNLYDIWGINGEYPRGIIGECKNYTKKIQDNKVSKSEIEKSCWRACKSGCLSFFIGSEYTRDAINEIGEYNNYKHLLCSNHKGAWIVPLKLSMIETIIDNNINFCYFIQWAISMSKVINSVANYL
jgi:hypothetical protein